MTCGEFDCHYPATHRRDGKPVCAQHATPDTLPVGASVTAEYPTRCSDCGRPSHRFATFPGGRCLDCHAHVTRHDPLPTATELARMWGA